MRFYTTTTGEKVPSVTTVLNLTRPAEDRHLLDVAMATNPLGFFLKTQRSRGRGLEVDGWFKRWIRKPNTPFPFEYRNQCDRLRRWWKSGGYELVDADLTVFGSGYAGTLDLLVRPVGSEVVYVVELKTTHYRPHDIAKREAELQAIAYCNAAQCDGTITLHVSPYGLLVGGAARPEEKEALTRQWLQRLGRFYQAYAEVMAYDL